MMVENPRVLIAYASRTGSTAEVAASIAEEFRESDIAADVRAVTKVTDLAPYDAVIVGSGIRAGRMMPEAVTFLQLNQSALSKIPVAYFVVCLTMREDTPENREIVMNYIEPVLNKLPQIEPVNVGLFGGTMDYKKLPFVQRVLVRMMRFAEGDYRDWNAISNWAQAVRAQMFG
jgi:menaquinone-dependent protoporphyrinogen oxidase